MDWESQDDGYVAALLVEDGAKDLAVGSPVLVFVEDQARPSTAGNPCWVLTSGHRRHVRALPCFLRMWCVAGSRSALS